MQNKSIIILITVVVSLLCAYNLSFTLISRGIENDAMEYATDNEGKYNPERKQAYLDSLYREPVTDLLVDEYTLEEVKQKELKLGLDLQGGMHVILEVDPKAFIQNMATLKKDPTLNQALEEASKKSAGSQKSFPELFLESYLEIQPDGKIARLFASSSNKEQIGFTSSNEEVVKYMESELKDAQERSFQILRSRIDAFGTAQPNIQALPGTGRIQVELPGVDNPERVRKLMTSVAKLEFVEVYTLTEIDNILKPLNDYLYDNKKLPEIAALSKSEIKTDSTGQETGSSSDFFDNLGSTSDTSAKTTDSSSTGDSSAIAKVDTLKKDSLATDTAKKDTTQKSSVFYELLQLTSLDQQEGRYYSFGALLQDTAKVRRMFNLPGVKAVLPAEFSYAWEYKPQEGSEGATFINIYFLKRSKTGAPTLSGDVITDARQNIGELGRPEVNMNMDAVGAREWKRITSENIGQMVAILLDNKVYSAPNINEPIPGGRSSISGSFTIQEAQDLANVLKAGKLPAPLRIVEEAVVGPTIGQESINNGLISMGAGLLIVLLFMIAYYSTGGVIANVALLVNIFFILGVLAQFNTALTLPGIASIVLTIGMSVDANVLIFERIREELRSGAKLLSAIELGFSKAFSSIVDANVTTFIIGAILFIFGTGGVKGFGVTLMIGIACSLFTAVFITHLLVEWLSRSKWANSLSFSAGWSEKILTNAAVPFMAKRRLAYIVSGSVIALGMGAIAINGMNLGVDFTGGRSYVVKFDEPVSSLEVRSKFTGLFESASTEVKTYNKPEQLKITTSYLINDESEAADQKVESTLLSGLKAEYAKLNPQVLSSSKIGATVADDIKGAALTSMTLSLILIFLYILVRFLRWQFSLGAIVALFHDILVVVAVFAIANLMGLTYEIDQVFIAAVLTVVGYSINDTVVVFDRIREMSGQLNNSEIVRNMDNSINNTLSRTLITSFTTFIVVVVLFVFGGEALAGFSFALLVGIVVGTYSSLLIASPIVYELSLKASKRNK